jgi:glycosyltransferase involved in cell wall biosynthesis
MVKVSVIIPFYNRIEYTKHAIKSVLNQTFSDFELIIIDDGSQNVLDLSIFEDNRIIYLKQSNKGVSAARNYGITVAKGEYIAFLDSDDYFEPQKLEIQYNVMIKNQNIVFSHTSYYTVNNDCNFIQYVESGKATGNCYEKLIINCPIATPTVMIKSNILKKYKFDENISLGEDIILWLSIVKEYELLGINTPLTNVRLHGNNASNSPIKSLIGKINICKSIITNDKRTHTLKKIQKELFSAYYSMFFIYLKKKYFLLASKYFSLTIYYFVLKFVKSSNS